MKYLAVLGNVLHKMFRVALGDWMLGFIVEYVYACMSFFTIQTT